MTGFPEGQYLAECRTVLAKADRALKDEFSEESYKKAREEHYLDPMKEVSAWEKEGKPVKAEEYGDILWDLGALGWIREELEFADRVIGELPPSASHTAYFVRGKTLLTRYDPAGIDDIYRAMAENNNYVEPGLDLIGSFCCMMGMQEELDTYRKKAVEIVQKFKEEGARLQNPLSAKDKLSADCLPDGISERNLEYIRSVSQGKIDKIYLVRRTVSDAFFASTYVIRFAPGYG